MKFALSLLSASLFGAATAAPPTELASTSGGGISASSPLGQSLLSRARRLEDGDDAYSYTWIEGYSLKFQGCHHIAQWNDYADEDEDVRIMTRRLARFRLCPSDSCSSNSAFGCKKGYGDYVVDLSIFAQAYYESKRRAQEQKCEMYLWKNCDCDDGDDKGDDFNEEYCEYDCYSAAGRDECIDRNPYNDDEEDDRREELDRYLECEQLEVEDDGDRRRLEEDEEEEFFVGPYCAADGAKVLLGVFKDDTCTEFADETNGQTTYETLVGSELPYSSTSIIGMDCMSCEEGEDVNRMKENEEYYAENGYYEQNDDEDEDRVADQCEQLYESAGKCEENLEDGVTDYPVNSACSYIAGIRITRQDERGIITGYVGASKTATAFIVLFALSFTALGAYVLYLKKSMGKTINLDS
eukprot:CAMPEP_0113573880 /NCGR_PEP_ID=MMETSP0015_2-20120614/26853_1 /TAXON_ID=2838 /ORGANISM="Odontella" /LENGTH=410 /DNA_ID=CAMNT_0000476987 /DNA_START=144 /DNA_END=1376 /DNA_ORIENTATION=- /assembly_acc=CAM_ASM_000160